MLFRRLEMQPAIAIALFLGLVLVASGLPVNQEIQGPAKDAPLPTPKEVKDKPESDKPDASEPEEAKDQEEIQKPNPPDAPAPKPKEGKVEYQTNINDTGMWTIYEIILLVSLECFIQLGVMDPRLVVQLDLLSLSIITVYLPFLSSIATIMDIALKSIEA